MRSSSCWPKCQRRQRNEPAWPGQEQSRKNRNLRTRVCRVLATRKILFQNVKSLGQKARAWLLSDQMDYDIRRVAEHHLDVANAAEEAGRLRVEGYRSIWTPAEPTGRGGTSGGTMAMIKPHWKFSRFLEGYGDLAEPLKRWDWTPIVLAFERSHFCCGICVLFHRKHCTGSQSGQNGANFGVHTLDSHAMRYCCRFQHGAPTSCGRLAGCRAWARWPTS